MQTNTRRLTLAALGVVGLALAVPAATALPQVEGGQIDACRNNVTGSLRIPGSGGCLERPRLLSETAVSWSVTGPAGERGPAGPAGPQGLTGPQGPTGPSGSATLHIYRQTRQSQGILSTSRYQEMVPPINAPAGTYLLTGHSVIGNLDRDIQRVQCALTRNGVEIEGSHRNAVAEAGPFDHDTLSFEAVATLDAPGQLGMVCLTPEDGVTAQGTSLVAWPVRVN